MTRSEIINSYIQKYNYKTYLEIGVNTPAQPGYNWPNVNVELKHGVDPNVDTTFKMTSDEFFDKHINQNYDFIFVDGLHIFEQCYRDVINSLAYLNHNGTVMIHDTDPKSEIAQNPVRQSDVWNGDVWKVVLKLRSERDDLDIFTIDTDEGCSIIRRGNQNTLKLNKSLTEDQIYSYSSFKNNREKILNLISVDDFKKRILS